MAHKNANANIALAADTSTLARASKEDSEVMKAIAVEGKKDGDTMKTIAILGMLFLPGTFLAVRYLSVPLFSPFGILVNTSQTVFAMPVFNWDGNGAPVLKPGFKYYWAVTIPVTVVVLTLWALAMALPWKRWTARISPTKPGNL